MRLFLCMVTLLATAQLTMAGYVPVTTAAGDFILGGPRDDFQVSTASTGESIALGALLRDGSYAPGRDGNRYIVPVGPAPGSTLSSWVFRWQYTPGASTSQSQPLVMLLIDTNPGVGVQTYTSMLFNPQGGPGILDGWDDTPWFRPNPGPGAWSNDSTPYVVAATFGREDPLVTLFGAPPLNVNGVAEFQLRGIVTRGGQVVASETIFVEVRPVPVPPAFVLMIIGTLSAVPIVRRFRRQ
jgi:hypothetical protein